MARLLEANGHQALCFASDEGSDASAIFMTAHDDQVSKQRAAREGVAYVVKPVAGDVLLASLARALGRR